MLAYSQGGASAPMGSMPQIENSVASAASGAQQALAMSQMVTQMEKTDAETAQIRSQTVGNDLVTARMVEEIQNLKATGRRTSEETMPNEELRDQLRTTTRATSAQAQKTSADARISNLTGMRDADTFEADVARRKAESKLTQMDLARGAADEKYNSDLGAMPKYLRLMLEVLRGTSSARGVR